MCDSYIYCHMLNFSKDDLENKVKQSKTFSNVCKLFGKSKNGFYLKYIKNKCKEFGISTEHFHPKKRISKICLHCGKPFTCTPYIASIKDYCSQKCGNQKSRGDYKSDDELITENRKYKRICFRFHKRECVVCGEKIAVVVHHYDENKKNDLPENLVPLCANHHTYWHSKYKHLVKEKIDKYVKDFIDNFKMGHSSNG